MLTIEPDDSPRFSLERRRGGSACFSSLGDDDIPRRSFSYLKLPQQLLKLSILKLDGSCFDVQVARTASVAELKQAVESVFSLSPKEGQGKISWSHVWGHFCLCYEGQKLLNDRTCIRSFGIKDGDQLHFIRHLSINYNPVKKQPKTWNAACEQQMIFSSGLEVLEEKEQNGDGDEYCEDDQEENEKYYDTEDGEDDKLIQHTEFKLAHFLRGWLSYSGLWCRRRTRSQAKAHPSRFAGHS